VISSCTYFDKNLTETHARCGCLAFDPSMVVGDSFDLTIEYELQSSAIGNSSASACYTLFCNSTIVSSHEITGSDTYSGSTTIQDITSTDEVTYSVCAKAQPLVVGDLASAYSIVRLSEVADVQNSDFVIGTPSLLEVLKTTSISI